MFVDDLGNRIRSAQGGNRARRNQSWTQPRPATRKSASSVVAERKAVTAGPAPQAQNQARSSQPLGAPARTRMLFGSPEDVRREAAGQMRHGRSVGRAPARKQRC